MRTLSAGTLRELATELNAEGRRVFPVETTIGNDGAVRHKKPVITGYHGDRPFTVEQICRWPWHRANALGWAIPTGFVLLDIDIKQGKAGDQHLTYLEALHGALPATAHQKTQSGGLHLLFQLPLTVERFHSRVPLDLAGGVFAAIDVCHSELRYMRIYDFSIFDQVVATLPRAWVDLITKRRKPQSNKSSTLAIERSLAGSEDPWEHLALAEVGDRNNQLNNAVFMLSLAGLWSDDHETRATQSAKDVGLDDEETSTTITSALTAGQRRRNEPEKWYEGLLKDQRLGAKRNRQALLQAGAEVRDLAVGRDMRVGLAVRDLALRLGVSHQTAARYLLDLRRLGYLRRDSPLDKVKASRFKLTVPAACSRSDSQPVSPAAGASSKQLVGGLSHLGMSSPPWLYRHDAFIRMAGAVHLPKSCAPVLHELAAGASTVAGLAATTGQPRSTVHRAVVILQSAGLVRYDSKVTRIVEPCFTDMREALDAWARFSHAQGNHERLETRFALHRALRDQPREGVETRGAMVGTNGGACARRGWVACA